MESINLRAWFAGQALAGLLAQTEGSFGPGNDGEIRPRWPANHLGDRGQLAKTAVEIADAMCLYLEMNPDPDYIEPPDS